MIKFNHSNIIAWLKIVRMFLGINAQNFRYRLSTLLVFIIVATFFWFLLTLRESYVARIHYPVNYQNFPKNKILVNTPPEKFIITARSDGYTMLRNKIKFKRSIPIDVNDFSLFALNNDSLTVYLLSKNLIGDMSKKLNRTNSEIDVIDIQPDTLFFILTPLKKARVPVILKLMNKDGFMAKQHKQNGPIVISPDSIVVSGPKNIIDTLTEVSTNWLSLTDISDTTIKKVKLQSIDNVKLSQDKVEIMIPIDQFTETSITVPVICKNVPDSFLLKTFPASVQISYLVTLSYFDKVKPSFFNAWVDYNEIQSNATSRLNIKLDSLPEYIYSPRLKPRTVEILREKTNYEDWTNRGNR